MKKILIAIALVAATTIANAQFVVSLQLSGAYNSGTTENLSTFTGISRLTGADTTYNFGDTTTHIPSMDITGGFKFGYQFVRTQVGIAGYFGMNRVKGEETIREFFDAHPESIQARWNLNVEDCQSEYTEQRMHFTIAPYVRHELIQFGDVALFAELNGYFTKVLQPLRHDFLDWYNHEMHYTIDTSFRITNSSVSIGAKITPGMSWQPGTPHHHYHSDYDKRNGVQREGFTSAEQQELGKSRFQLHILTSCPADEAGSDYALF